MKESLIVISGPTASGKTDLAIKLAKKFSAKGLLRSREDEASGRARLAGASAKRASGWKGVEIICADSRTIYKGMDIGTAKPRHRKYTRMNHKCSLINGVPHYMIDIVRPNQEFTAAQFKNLALKIIGDIHRRGKIPFLVGGTGLYISTIVDNLEIPAVPPDKKLRKKLERSAEKYGTNYLYKKLLLLDPGAKKIVQKENVRRVIRALEVCLKTKKPFSQLRQKGVPLFDVLQIGVKMTRQQLYRRINQRVDEMIKMGLVEEVKRLAKRYSLRLPSMSGIGYRQIGLYLKNKISLNQAIELIKRDTRHYAKRQMTWFKRHPAPEQVRCGTSKRIRWISPTNFKKAQKLIEKII